MPQFLQRLVGLSMLAPWLTVCIAVALGGLAMWVTATTLTFETSRHTLASSGAHYVQVENALAIEFDRISHLLDESDHSSLHVIAAPDSLPALRLKTAQFNSLPVVERVESVASVIPENQAARLPLIKALAPYAEGIETDTTDLAPIDLSVLQRLLRKIRFKLQRGAHEWAVGQQPSEAA